MSLFDQVTFCDHSDVIGAFVECGVWKGGAVGLMAFTTLAAMAKCRAAFVIAYDYRMV